MTKSTKHAFTFFEPGQAPIGVDETALARARSAIDKLKRAYVTEWAPAALDELERTLKMALTAPGAAGEQLALAYRLAHDMKGQGATFGYALVSDIGGALCVLTHDRAAATAPEIQAMLAHVNAARAILTEELDDPGLPEAVAVMENLRSVLRGNLH